MSPDSVGDILRDHVRSADQLEHLQVRAEPDSRSFLAALFLMQAPDPEDPVAATMEIALRLCRSAIAASPELAGWVASLHTGDTGLTADVGPRRTGFPDRAYSWWSTRGHS